MTPMVANHFLVRCAQLRDHRAVQLPRGGLAAGAVELRVDRFGLTSNNVTYGVLGESLSYFRFFPTEEAGWARLPVWGFGTVVRSGADDVAVGERFYGFYPMSSHLVVEPRRVDGAGFLDGAAHRRGLGSVYNQYMRTTGDPNYAPETEAHQVVLRPVFATAFFIVDFLEQSHFFGAQRLIVSSASSKLGCAIAFLLRVAAARRQRQVVGLTSARNASFVGRLGVYDAVVQYDEVASIGVGAPTVYIDLAGDAGVRAEVHRRLAATLRHSSVIGATHWEARGVSSELPGPKPAPFFAPAWIKRRAEEWGAGEMQSRLAAGWKAFLREASQGAQPWVTIIECTGPEAVAQAYDTLIAGEARPDAGYVLSLFSPDSA